MFTGDTFTSTQYGSVRHWADSCLPFANRQRRSLKEKAEGRPLNLAPFQTDSPPVQTLWPLFAWLTESAIRTSDGHKMGSRGKLIGMMILVDSDSCDMMVNHGAER